MQNQKMVGIPEMLLRRETHQFVFHFTDVPSRSQVCSIGHSKDVRIDRYRIFQECGIQDHVGRLTPNSGQVFQVLATSGDLAPMPFD
jgi:hypothetical protein